jgi:hypothetical protein
LAIGKHRDHAVLDVTDAAGVRNELSLVSEKADLLLSSLDKREQEINLDMQGNFDTSRCL